MCGGIFFRESFYYLAKVCTFSWGVLLRESGCCGIFLDYFDWGGGFFLIDFLEDIATPVCFISVRVLPILTNSCWLRFGWGFLGFEDFNFPFVFLGGWVRIS